jgi:hypothetical protein
MESTSQEPAVHSRALQAIRNVNETLRAADAEMQPQSQRSAHKPHAHLISRVDDAAVAKDLVDADSNVPRLAHTSSRDCKARCQNAQRCWPRSRGRGTSRVESTRGAPPRDPPHLCSPPRGVCWRIHQVAAICVERYFVSAQDELGGALVRCHLWLCRRRKCGVIGSVTHQSLHI